MPPPACRAAPVTMTAVYGRKPQSAAGCVCVCGYGCVPACLLARAAASTRLATLPEAGACRGAVAVGQWCLLPSVSHCSKATGGRKLAPLQPLQAIGWLHFSPTASSSSSIGGQRVGVCNFVRAVLALHMTHDTTTNQAKTRSTYKSTRVHKTRRGHYFIGFVW